METEPDRLGNHRFEQAYALGHGRGVTLHAFLTEACVDQLFFGHRAALLVEAEHLFAVANVGKRATFVNQHCALQRLGLARTAALGVSAAVRVAVSDWEDAVSDAQ